MNAMNPDPNPAEQQAATTPVVGRRYVVAGAIARDDLVGRATDAARGADRTAMRALSKCSSPTIAKTRDGMVADLANQIRDRRSSDGMRICLLGFLPISLIGLLFQPLPGTPLAYMLQTAGVLAGTVALCNIVTALFAPALVRRAIWPQIVSDAALLLHYAEGVPARCSEELDIWSAAHRRGALGRGKRH